MLDFIISIGSGLLIGGFIALIYSYKTKCTTSMRLTLILMPAIVAMVITCVNGNLGAGIAVAGAFSLVRFRSVPGTAEEIVAIFLAMSAGIGCGMGWQLYSAVFVAVLGAVMFIYKVITKKGAGIEEKTLRITVPEDLNYNAAFEEVLKKYTHSSSLVGVKTTNMGSLYKLSYNVQLKPTTVEKEFLDELRCRNGNLEISIMLKEADPNAL